MAAGQLARQRFITKFTCRAGRLSARQCGIGFTMSEAKNLFAALRQSADPGAAAAIEELVLNAPDCALSRVNVLDFAVKSGLDEERAIAAFLQAARLGLLSCHGMCCARVARASSMPARR